MGLFSKFNLGELKNLDDITIDDMKENPIWVNDLSGETVEGYDESSERPVLNTNNVTKKLISKFFSVTILIYCDELKLHGAANVESLTETSTLVFWKDRKWQENNDFIERESITIKCIPEINGAKDFNFKYNIESDTGSLY